MRRRGIRGRMLALLVVLAALGGVGTLAHAAAPLPCVPGVNCPPSPPPPPPPTPPPTKPPPNTPPPRAQGPDPVSAPEVGIEDEGVSLFAGAASPFIVAQWRAFGIDYVRLQAYWQGIAPAGNSTTMPRGFQAANPNDPRYNWGALDNAVDTVRRYGMKVMLTISQAGPRWASDEPRSHANGWKPKAARFAQFATAVAKRYGGRVDRYLLGNEPNQRIFLAPQYVCRRGHCESFAPHRYRELVNAAYPAVKRADRGAQVLMGELAPIGSTRLNAGSSHKPLAFVRAMGCVTAAYRPMRSGLCRHFRAPKSDGFSFHPYTIKTPPHVAQKDKDLAKIGDLPRFLATLDRMTGRHRLRASTGRFSLFLTEFGYLTNPPSRKYGISPLLQERYLAESAYIAWKLRRRIKLITQYEWNDDPVFPSGLLTSGNVPKPAYNYFTRPFYIDAARGLSHARFWGQVRPGASHQVTVQVRRRGARSFTKVATVKSDRGGYWSFARPALRGAVYRYSFPGGAFGINYSNEVKPR